MGLLDIFQQKKKKKAEERIKRPPKGALKRPKKIEDKPLKIKKEGAVPAVVEKSSEIASQAILSPHITEKSSILSEKENAYVFKAAKRANKVMIKRAIKELYGFSPKKITVTNMPAKLRKVRGKTGVKPGFKKVVVFLNKGEKIDLA